MKEKQSQTAVRDKEILKNLDYSEKNKLNLILTQVEVEHEKLTSPLTHEEIEGQIRTYQKQNCQNKIKLINQDLKEAEANRDKKTVQKLSQEINKLTQKITALDSVKS